jgi:REP element-mobilizing transposase RayT
MSVTRKIKLMGPHLVFVTTTINRWIPVFADNECARVVLNQLRETANIMDVAIVGYVIMPPHIHALLGFKNIAMLIPFMQSFKSLSSRALKQQRIVKFDNRFSKMENMPSGCAASMTPLFIQRGNFILN